MIDIVSRDLNRYLRQLDADHEIDMARESYEDRQWRTADLLEILYDDITTAQLDELNDLLRQDSAKFGHRVERMVRERIARMAKDKIW